VAREQKFCYPRKGPDFKQALQFLKGIANLPWLASDLSNPQSLTHAAVARGPIWSRAFGPAMLHGCTPLPEINSIGFYFFCNHSLVRTLRLRNYCMQLGSHVKPRLGRLLNCKSTGDDGCEHGRRKGGRQRGPLDFENFSKIGSFRVG